jgi:hypothetical protein
MAIPAGKEVHVEAMVGAYAEADVEVAGDSISRMAPKMDGGASLNRESRPVGSCPCLDAAMTLGLLLTLIFLVLKLTGNISWNWFIVFLPVIIEFVLSLATTRSVFWWRTRNL